MPESTGRFCGDNAPGLGEDGSQRETTPASQLTGALLGEEFVQAGSLLADKDGEPRPHLAVTQSEFRLQRPDQPVQPAAQLGERPPGRDNLGLDAHEEQLAVFDVLF